MPEAILYMAMSLDGRVAGKNDDLSWLMPYNDADYGYEKFFAGVGAIIQGRRAYDVEIERGWENAHPVPTFVLPHGEPQRKPQRPDVIFTHDDIADVLKQAKARTNKHIWIEGGARVAQQFLQRRLLDRMILSLVPVILGEGPLLLDKMDREVGLTLVDVARFDKGLAQLSYSLPS